MCLSSAASFKVMSMSARSPHKPLNSPVMTAFPTWNSPWQKMDTTDCTALICVSAFSQVSPPQLRTGSFGKSWRPLPPCSGISHHTQGWHLGGVGLCFAVLKFPHLVSPHGAVVLLPYPWGNLRRVRRHVLPPNISLSHWTARLCIWSPWCFYFGTWNCQPVCIDVA